METQSEKQVWSYKAKVGLYEHKCKQCGKHFECRSEYAYKLSKRNSTKGFHYFCSYKCLRAYEEEHSKKKKPNEKERQMLELLKAGIGLNEISRQLDVSKSYVTMTRDKWGNII